MNKFWSGNRDGTWADRKEFPLSASSLTLQQHTAAAAAADSYLVGPKLGVTCYQQLTQTFTTASS